jgi:integrase
MAKQQEGLKKVDLMKGVEPSRKATKEGVRTFRALAKAYLALPAIKRQATFSFKEITITKRFIPYFKDIVLTAITPSKVEGYRELRRLEERKHGGSLKTATINRDLALLKHMLSYAVREEWLDKNPVSRVKFEKENNVRDRILDPEEFQRLQDHSAPHLQAINLMAYQTGMRSGEIIGLTWDRVDFKAGMTRLRPEDTKTEEARLIPLTSDLTPLLRDLYKVCYLYEKHVFLVKGQSVNSVKTAFKAACRRAKIEGFKFHDFRHTAVTNMRRAGIDHLTIMRITGHKTLEVFKRYNSFLEGDLREAASRFNTYLTLAHSNQNSDLSKSLINQ